MDKEAPVYVDIARRLRGLKDALDLTAEQIAERIDMTAEKVRLYESGTHEIPVSYLFAVAKAFGVDPTVLLSGSESHLHNFSLVKKGRGMSVDKRRDYAYKSLAYRFAGRIMDPFIVTVPPKTEAELTFNRHSGQEFIHMQHGRMEIVLGDKRLILEPGDSLYFNSDIAHAMRGLDGRPAVFLDVII